MEVGFLEAMEYMADSKSGSDKALVVQETGNRKTAQRRARSVPEMGGDYGEGQIY